MPVIKKELIKEFEYRIEGLDFPVKGWIYRSNEVEHLPYLWKISHYYKPHEGAMSVYRPSRRHAETIEEAELLLNRYVNDFTTIDVVPA